MENIDVEELYKMVPVGTKVVIVDGVYGAFGKGFRNLKSGMYGSDVLEIQKRLKELGFFMRNSKWQIWSRNRKCCNKVLQRKWNIYKEDNRCRFAAKIRF